VNAFCYEARDVRGRIVRGEVSAPTRQLALAQLRGQQLFASHLAEHVVQTRTTGSISTAQRAALLSQLADLLHSGIPLLKALDLIRAQAASPRIASIVTAVRDQVSDGAALAESMASASDSFGPLTVSMVRAGEEGGFLEASLKRVATFLEQQAEFRSRVVGALIYPLLLLSVSVVILLGMMLFLVPKFGPIFGRLEQRGALPLLTQLVVAGSDALRGGGWIVGLLVIAGLAAIAATIPRPKLLTWWNAVLLRAPIAGSILKNLAVARFCRVLGTMLTSGVPLMRALHIARDATGIAGLSQAIGAAMQSVSSGQSLVKPLAATGQFSRDVLEVIAIGEQSNDLDRVLIDLADTLERRTQRKLETVVKLLEPGLLLVLAGIVLLMVIALLLPMMQAAGNLA